MKAKMYRFIFSALLICFAAVGKAQTIDGKLYTPFNNYYQWIGGKFNNNLNIPKVAATNGRDTGGIRYSLTDSSMYVWTGSQWRAVGSSLDTSSLSNRIEARVKYSDTAAMLANYLDYVPTLQQVTTAGNTTTDNIYLISESDINRQRIRIEKDEINSIIGIRAQSEALIELIVNDSAELRLGYTYIKENDRTTIDNIYLPDSSGTLTQRVKVNGTTYNTAANGVVDLGTIQSDTATVVKAYVTNAEAVTITKGQVVYIFGASGDRAAVKLAKNTSDTFSSKTLGIVRADIAAGQAGWVTTQGQVSGINLGAYTEGDILWLDSVPGGFTKVKPVAPYHGVFVGVVERANAGNGLIYVKPQNGQELDELHNVKITSPKSGDAITYTPASQIWENRQVVLKQDTIPLAVFNVGSAAAGDTTAFSTSTLAGSFYLDGTDTMFVTSYRVALQGTSASITPEVWFNDSLNVTAGGTRLATGSAITNLTTGTSVTPTTNKIPPANFVFVRFSAVTTKPTYFTLTLFGYRIRKQ